MKKVTIISLLLFFATGAFCQWKIDKGHSKFTFIAAHHGISEVDGYFKKFDGQITSSKDDLSDAVFEMNIEVASINTDLEMRDESLRGADMFDAQKFPLITFKSISWKKISGNKYEMTGNITIKNITKTITLDVTMNGPVASPDPRNKKLQIGIKALTTIKRSDFNIGEKLPVSLVGDEIQIRATGEFQKD